MLFYSKESPDPGGGMGMYDPGGGGGYIKDRGTGI